MNWKALRLAVVTFGLAATAPAATPMTFKEIALFLRNGEQQPSILADVTSRKLAAPLSAEQEAVLRSSGAGPEFLNALRSPALLASNAASAGLQRQPPPAPTRTTVMAGVLAARGIKHRVVQLGDAFSLSQLEQAKAKAVAERKPLGFIMVWGQFFGVPANTRLRGSAHGLAHFCEAFNNNLVLVFVRHETELGSVPNAVKQGFNGPDEGGFAPNMAVVDATASEFIVEIPYGGDYSDGEKRDQVFSAGAAKIDGWLKTHPLAVAQAPVK